MYAATLPREEALRVRNDDVRGPELSLGRHQKLTWLGETKKICAGRPFTVTVVPPTLRGKSAVSQTAELVASNSRAGLRAATAMLSGATALRRCRFVAQRCAIQNGQCAKAGPRLRG